jgi:tetratricopeptide (TPR) repeat protein
VALRKVDSFPPRYAALAKGLGAYGLGQADSAVTYLRAALALDHRWAEAHMALGEVYFHYVPPGGYPFEAARAAFDSALIYDPGFAAPLFHAIQHAVWDADRPRADSLFRRFSSTVVHPVGEYEQLTLMRGCLDGTSTPERWSEAVGRSMSSAVQAATWLVVGGLRQPGCARDGLEAIVASRDIDWRWYYYATVELASVDAALGNVAEVRHLLEQLGTSADVVSIFLASSGLPVGDLADAALDRLRRLPDSTTTPLGVWAAGTWAIERGDSRSASLLLERLARLDPGSDGRSHQLLQESLRARLTLMRGDTAAAIAALRRLTPTAEQAALRWNSWEALPWERFRLAQLLVTRGRLREAGEVASEFDSPASFGYVPWLPASLLLREQVERRSGDAPYANELRRRYLSLTEGNSQPYPPTRR